MDNMKIVQEGGEYVAVLPPHPDMPDEELGLPAPTREAAEAEARAYNAITQSSLYKFEFDEIHNTYVVSLGKEGERFEADLLAEAYQKAQEAYAKRVSAEPPPEEKKSQPVKRGPRKKANNGGGEVMQIAPEQPAKIASGPLPKEPVHEWQQDKLPTTVDRFDQIRDRTDMLEARINKLEAILLVLAQTILKEIKNDG